MECFNCKKDGVVKTFKNDAWFICKNCWSFCKINFELLLKRKQTNGYQFHYKRIKTLFPSLFGIKTLEVGCQTANTSCQLAINGAKTYCIDNEPKELEKGILNFGKNNAKGKFYSMSAFELEFNDNYFDVVFNHGVLEHYRKEQQNKMLQEMKRVSKRFVYVSVPNKLHYRTKEIEQKQKGNFSWEKEYFPMAIWELEKLFQQNQIKIIESFGSLHYFNKTKTIQNTIGKYLGFEICIIGEKTKGAEHEGFVE